MEAGGRRVFTGWSATVLEFRLGHWTSKRGRRGEDLKLGYLLFPWQESYYNPKTKQSK